MTSAGTWSATPAGREPARHDGDGGSSAPMQTAVHERMCGSEAQRLVSISFPWPFQWHWSHIQC